MISVYCYVEQEDIAENELIDYIEDDATRFYPNMKELIENHGLGGGSVFVLDIKDFGTIEVNPKYKSRNKNLKK